MNKDVHKVMSDKQVLEYYKLYGRDRDIKQYLALPLTVDLDSTAEHIDSKEGELSNSNPSEGKDAVASTSKSTHEPVDGPEETEYKNGSGSSIPEKQEDHIKSKSEHVKSIKIKHDQGGDQQGFSFNVESEIEINYQIDLPQSDNDDIVQGIPDKTPCKPKGILKVDDGFKQKVPKHIELPADNETIMHLISPTSSISSNRRQTVSPTSSIASNRRLEWDSLADVGYNMTENVLPKKQISTLERIALEDRRKEQYKAVLDVFKIPGQTDKYSNFEQKSLPAVVQSPKMNKNIGKPTAESTPIAPKLELSEVHETDISKINIDKNEQKTNTRTDKPHLKHCKSLNDIDLKLLSNNKVNKYIQTTLPRDSTLKDVPHLDLESCEGDSNKKTVLGKENIAKSPARNKYRSKMLRRQRILRRKLATSTPFQADCDEENSPDKSSAGINALEILKGDNRFNISQSTVGTNTIGQESENRGMRAESFEYMPGDAYDKHSNNSENAADLKSSDAVGSLKRNKKLENVSNMTSSKSNDSISSKNDKQSTYNSPNNESSTNSELLFYEAKYSTLNRDIKTSVRLLNSLISCNKGNMELKKRMVRRVMKRLLEANYVDTSTAESSSISKSKDSESSNIMQSTLNSASKSVSTSVSPDPSYSLPEHLIANVPWKPYKFSQGIDYIRLPKAQHENIEKPSCSHAQGTKSTHKNRDDTSNSTESFVDLLKKSVKSPENMVLINEQQMLQQNLVKQQMGFDKKQTLDTSGILSYVKKEKANQLAWINSEIQHLNYLKMLLESQSEKDKTDSTKSSHASSMPGQMSEIPNPNVVHSLISNIEEIELKKRERLLITSNSTSAEDIFSEKKIKDQRMKKEHFKSSPRKSRVTPNVSETNTSSSSQKSSIREQIRELTRNIELLKQSTQFAKNTSSTHSSRVSYTEWDSHVNTSRAYSEVQYIHDSKNSSRNKRLITKPAEKSKSSNMEMVSKIPTSTKDMFDNKDKSDKIDSSKSKTNESHSSDTHTSLKSATISIGGQNVSSKSTEKSRASSSADPGWQMSLQNKIEQKPEVQTISTQTSDHLLKKDKTVMAKIRKCSNCKHSSCKCKKQQIQSSEHKSKDLPKAVAYVLTFENESTASSSSKPSRKQSLDEVKIKLPYKNERIKSSKHRTIKKDINDNKKGHKTCDSKKTKSVLEEIESTRSQIIETGILKSNSKLPDESNNTSDVTIVNSSNITGASKYEDNSDSSTITNSKSTHTVSESTLLSTSTDSFIMEGRQQMNVRKPHNPTVQECLMIYKSDFVRRAEKRRHIIQKIAELRSERNEQRKRLLQLINDNPDIRHDLNNMKEVLTKPTKPQRVFTSKEIRDMTRKKYKNLPEVKQKKRDVLRNNLYRNNRFIAGIFNKRLQKKVLQGKLTLSQSMTIVNGCD